MRVAKEPEQRPTTSRVEICSHIHMTPVYSFGSACGLRGEEGGMNTRRVTAMRQNNVVESSGKGVGFLPKRGVGQEAGRRRYQTSLLDGIPIAEGREFLPKRGVGKEFGRRRFWEARYS